jgi:hypothetical protein
MQDAPHSSRLRLSLAILGYPMQKLEQAARGS